MLVRPVGLVEQELGGGPAELVFGLAHRAERHRRVGRELDVVVADQGQVCGHRHPSLGQPAQQAQSQHVVGAEYGGRLAAGAEELIARRGAAARIHRGDGHLDQHLCGVESGPLHRVVGATAAVGALPDRGRTVDQGDAAVPEAHQVRDGDLAAAPVVHGHRALPGRTRPVKQHHRGATLADPA